MKKRGLLAILILCSVLVMLLSTTTTYAQTPQTVGISSYVIRSDDGRDVTNGPLMAGATYTASLEINVGVELANATLSLETPMQKVEDVYWKLENDYPGVDTESWQPGQAVIDFNASKGIAQFTVKGSIPFDYTQETLSNGESDEVLLHFARSISLVKLSLDSEVLEERSVEVVDQAILVYRQTITEKESLLQTASTDPTYRKLSAAVIAVADDLSSNGYVQNAIDLLDILPVSASDFPSTEKYQQALDEKNSLMQTLDIDPTYEELAANVIALAEDLSGSGYVQNAIDLLDTLPSSASGFPSPVSEKSFLPYLIIIVVLAVILVTFFALFLKARSSSSLISQQVDEEAGRLDVLLVRVSKIDKQLASDIEQIKEQLERISGR